jgi:hypothetical protein
MSKLDAYKLLDFLAQRFKEKHGHYPDKGRMSYKTLLGLMESGQELCIVDLSDVAGAVDAVMYPADPASVMRVSAYTEFPDNIIEFEANWKDRDGARLRVQYRYPFGVFEVMSGAYYHA